MSKIKSTSLTSESICFFKVLRGSQLEKEQVLSEHRDTHDFFEKKKSWSSSSRRICGSDKIVWCTVWIGQTRIEDAVCWQSSPGIRVSNFILGGGNFTKRFNSLINLKGRRVGYAPKWKWDRALHSRRSYQKLSRQRRTSSRKRKSSFWALRYPQFPWNASWSSCSRRKSCLNKIFWSRISYEEASWGTKRFFIVWSPIWAGHAGIVGRRRRQSSSSIRYVASFSEDGELYQANQVFDQCQREKSWLCTELHRRERVLQEGRVRSLQEIEDLKRCLVQKLRERNKWEPMTFLFKSKKSRSTVNQLMVQIQILRLILWTIPEWSMILIRQAVLGYPTFPASLWVCRVFVEW